VKDGIGGVFRGDLEDAETQLRDVIAVVALEAWNGESVLVSGHA
jgi:hypothetical protein